MGIIGQSIPVRDAAMKVTGQFKYTADLEFPGMLHAKILFSPVPHARIKKTVTKRNGYLMIRFGMWEIRWRPWQRIR